MARRASGFTLIELLVTLTVLVVVLAAGLPSFRSIIQSNQLNTATNELQSALSFARSEALRRRQPVAVCALPGSGAITCANAADFSKGWLVFVDNGAGPGRFDAGEEQLLVRQGDASLGGLDLQLSGGQVVRYRERGELDLRY